jgi:hypothetical protein
MNLLHAFLQSREQITGSAGQVRQPSLFSSFVVLPASPVLPVVPMLLLGKRFPASGHNDRFLTSNEPANANHFSTYPANGCGTQLGYVGTEAVRYASCNNRSSHTDR